MPCQWSPRLPSRGNAWAFFVGSSPRTLQHKREACPPRDPLLPCCLAATLSGPQPQPAAPVGSAPCIIIQTSARSARVCAHLVGGLLARHDLLEVRALSAQLKVQRLQLLLRPAKERRRAATGPAPLCHCSVGGLHGKPCPDRNDRNEKQCCAAHSPVRLPTHTRRTRRTRCQQHAGTASESCCSEGSLSAAWAGGGRRRPPNAP